MNDAKRKYRRVQRWFRDNPEKRSEYNARYYAKTAEERREKARLKRLENPAKVRQFNVAFRARHPNYMRDYCVRRKIRNAWLNWSVQCAHSRQSLGDGSA